MNPHPPLSSLPFPLALLLTAIELLIICGYNLEQTKKIILLALALSLPLTYFSGYWGSDFANLSFTVPESEILKHQGYAKFALFLFFPLLLIPLLIAVSESSATARVRYTLKLLYRALLLAFTSCLLYTSFLGGELVFSHGAGVRVSPQP